MDKKLIAYMLAENPVKFPDNARVVCADRCHFQDLPLDELHPVVLVEDPGLGHAMVVVDGETPPGNLLRFRLHGKSSEGPLFLCESILPGAKVQ